MKLLEHEAKNLFAKYHLPTPAGRLWRAGQQIGELNLPAVVKAQVPVGGRGKAGGIRLVETRAELEVAGAALLGRELLGHTVGSVLVEDQVVPTRELYVAIALDRAKQAFVLLGHPVGGIDINNAAGADGAVLKIVLDGAPPPAAVGRLLDHVALDASWLKPLEKLVSSLWQLCVQEDAVLVEVNPLMTTADGRLICADAKIELDDDAAFRHTDRVLDTTPASAQFVVLSPLGTIATLANGAGLAMATNDAIKAAGEEPANFFDVGGGTGTAAMIRGFHQIAALPSVQAIVVNIFAGITRCDEVARAIIEARAANAHMKPLFIRLAGTNAAEGAQLLKAAGLALWPTLGDCVEQAAAQVRHV
jgi:succinyl-CoA synthetase beta subunit